MSCWGCSCCCRSVVRHATCGGASVEVTSASASAASAHARASASVSASASHAECQCQCQYQCQCQLLSFRRATVYITATQNSATNNPYTRKYQ